MFVRGPGNKPRATVVSEHHAVFLQRNKNHLRLGRKAVERETGSQPEPLAQRRELFGGQPRGGVASGANGVCASAGRREPERVPNLTGGNLVIAHQARQNGQTRSVGGSPAIRAEAVASKVEDRARSGFPGSVRLRMSAID